MQARNSLKMHSSTAEVKQIPRLLNERFSVAFYDGGVFNSAGAGGNFDIENVLVPTKDGFHCSDSGTKKNLVLKCSSDFTLTHIFLQAPRRKCTEPIRHCLAWVSDCMPNVELSKYYDDMPIEVIKSKFSDGEPIVVTTSRESMEGETEIRPWRSGRYVHLKFFDTHSETQENIDIAVVGLVGFVGAVPEYHMLGPWSKRQLAPPRAVHAHTLTATFSNRGWCCDGRDFSGGCRGGFNDFNETSVYDATFRCAICGFDLCEYCAGDSSVGSVSLESAAADLSNLRADRNAQSKRIAFNRVKMSLRIDPSALGAYLQAGLLETLGRFKYTNSRDPAMLLSLILSRLSPSSLRAVGHPDLYAVYHEGEVRAVLAPPGARAEVRMACTDLVDGTVRNFSPLSLIPVGNCWEMVSNTAQLFAYAIGDYVPPSGSIEDVLERADVSIPNAAGEMLADVAEEHEMTELAQLVRSTEPAVAEMELVEEVSGILSPSPDRRLRSQWLADLRRLVVDRLVVQMAQADSFDADLVRSLIAIEPDFSTDVKVVTLRLLNSGFVTDIANGVRLLARIAGRESNWEALRDFSALEWATKARSQLTGTAVFDELSVELELVRVACPSTRPVRLPIDASADAICEYLLLLETLSVNKFVADPARSGFAQVTTPMALRAGCSQGTANGAVEYVCEPIASLSQFQRALMSSQPVVNLEFIRYSFELIGCVIDLSVPRGEIFAPASGGGSPATRRPPILPASSGHALVTGFEIHSDLQLGLHAVKFVPVAVDTSPKSSTKRLLLANRDFVVLRRENPIVPHLDLRAKLTFERLRDPAAASELKDMRHLLDVANELVVIENPHSALHSILPLLGLTHSPRGWLVPPAGLSTDVLIVLDACFRQASTLLASPQSSFIAPPADLDDRVFSVTIQVDTSEIPFELLWPMIRDEVLDSVRPYMARSWPGASLVRLEQIISAGIRGGSAAVARALSREDAEAISRRLGGVIQSAVVEDRAAAAAAAQERAQSEPGSPGMVVKKSPGQRVKWTLPALEERWLFGTVISAKDNGACDILDETSSCVFANVPSACIGGGAGGMRQRLRENLRRRLLEESVPGLIQLRPIDAETEDERLLNAFTTLDMPHEDMMGEEDDGEDDGEDGDEGEEGEEDAHVGAGGAREMSPMSVTDDVGDFNVVDARDRIMGRLMGSLEQGFGNFFLSIGDFLTGVGGPEGPPTEPLVREIEGVARGSSLNAPIGERHNPDDLLLKRIPPAHPPPASAATTRLVVELRLAGTEMPWLRVTDDTAEFPILSLWPATGLSFSKSASLIEFRFETEIGRSSHEASGSAAYPSKRQRVVTADSEDDTVVSSPRHSMVAVADWLESLEHLCKMEERKEAALFQVLRDTLTRKLSSQLDQIVVLVAESFMRNSELSLLPDWVFALPERFPQLFPETLRQKLLLYTSLPPALTVHWIQEHRLGDLLKRRAQLQSDLNTELTGRRMQQLSQELSNVEERVTRNPFWLGCVKNCLAKLRKAHPAEFIAMADELLMRIANSSNLLEIQFEGESGFGSAVTRSFFSEVGKHFTRPESGWLVGRRGMRLRPRAAVAESVVEECRLFGRLVGRALAEGYIVPLPVALETWAMIRDPSEERPESILPRPGDATDGEFVGAAVALANSLSRDPSINFDEEWKRVSASSGSLEELGAVFLTTGFSGEELMESGALIHVSRENVAEFAKLAKQRYLHSGIDFQLAAIRQGIDQVFPVDALHLLTPEELKTAICGEEEIAWTDESLREILHFNEGLGDLSDWLIEILIEMSNAERANFLDFVTSCPRLPPGGTLRIEVISETIASSNLTSPVLRPALPPVIAGSPMLDSGTSSASEEVEVVGYPRSRACVNHLYLPRYRSRQTLRDRLVEAMVSSVHHDEITG